MKNITLEVTYNPATKKLDGWLEAPAFGDSHEPRAGARVYATLNNGIHRVKIAVFNATLTHEQLKSLAREAVSFQPTKW